EEFQNGHAHLFITPTALPGYRSEPILPSQFPTCERLNHVQELLGDQAFKLTKRLFLEDRLDLRSLLGLAFFEKQLPGFAKQRHWRALNFPFEFLPPLKIG